MKNIDSYRKRFYGLLESTMGDVKPLIMEQTYPGNFSINENGFSGTYSGPEFDNTGGDVAHQFSNTASNAVGKKLKELYKSGVYKKVDMDNIVMSTEGMGSGDVVYKLTIPFVSVTNKCDAYTSFDHRGGWGHGGDDKKNDVISELGNEPVDGTNLDISREYKTPEGLVEYWVQWKNKNYQSDCGGTKSVSTQKETKTITHNSDPETLRQGLKSLGQIYNPKLILNPDSVSVIYEKTGTEPINLSYVYSNVGEKEKVLEKVKLSNSVERETEYNIDSFKGYIIFIMK